MATRKTFPESGDVAEAGGTTSTTEAQATSSDVVDQVEAEQAVEQAAERVHRPRYEGSKPPAIRQGGTHNFEV